jgi:uncharacterized protein (TIGR03435 family)
VPHSPNLRAKLLLLTLSSIALAALPAHAQHIAGSWQGTLQVGEASHRIVLKISKSDTGALKADEYDIDSGGLRIPVNDVTFDGSTLKFPMTGHGGNYVGKMSADGNTIVGGWKDDSQSVSITFKRATPETAWVIPQPVAPTAMAADAHPLFEVATIKPSAPGEDLHGRAPFLEQGRHYSAKTVTLINLIKVAYWIQPQQILNAPAWAETDKFDIEAEPDTAGRPTTEQYREMYRKLLEDRFKLSIHRDQKQFPVYALRPEKDGPKIAKSSAGPKDRSYSLLNPGPHGGSTFTYVNVTMASLLSDLMQPWAIGDRRVVDQTGLTGRYDFSLTFAPDPLSPDAGTAPDIFHAVQQQLGLKLQPTTAPVEVIVIDHVEPPTPN